MLIYSLRFHEVVKTLPFYNVSSFASSKLFTVIVSRNRAFFHLCELLTSYVPEYHEPTYSSCPFIGIINHTTYYFFLFHIWLQSYINT